MTDSDRVDMQHRQATESMTTIQPVAGCDLCEAARMTPWYYSDDMCWVAECEFCSVPMVVWRVHHSVPPDDVKAMLHARLDAVVSEHFQFDHFVDDRMRNIPDHYHAHARRRRFS